MPEISDQELADLKANAEKVSSLTKAAEDFKADMFRFKQESAEKEAKLAKLLEGQEAADKAKLAEQGQYKTLLEKSEAEKAELRLKADTAVESVTHFVRFKSVEAEARKAGILDASLSDLNLLGLDKLEVQREGKEIRVKGVEEFVAEQKKLRPHWFGKAEAPNIDKGKGGGSAGSGGGSLDAKAMAELYTKDKAAYIEALKSQVTAKG